MGYSVNLVRTDVSDERVASIIRVTLIGELETDTRCEEIVCTLVFLRSVLLMLPSANVLPSSPILVTLTMEAMRSSETSVHHLNFTYTIQGFFI
jgi:hypothetical protein